MPFPFLGYDTRTYTQFRNLATDTPLIAAPGGVYDMAPVGGLNLPVPPGDGLWGPEQAPAGTEPGSEAADEPAAEPAGQPVPPVLINVPAEPEEN